MSNADRIAILHTHLENRALDPACGLGIQTIYTYIYIYI